MRYLTNPFVLIGTIGIIYYVVKRRKLKTQIKTFDQKILPASTKSVEENKYAKGLPLKFINKVANMPKEEIKSTMKHNVKMMERTDLSDADVDKINKMINYLAEEYDKR